MMTPEARAAQAAQRGLERAKERAVAGPDPKRFPQMRDWWRVTYPDGQSFETFCHPRMTEAEIRKARPPGTKFEAIL